MSKIDRALEQLQKIATYASLEDPRFCGVLFSEHGAFVVHEKGDYAIRINEKYELRNHECPFYSYIKQDFIENPMAIAEESCSGKLTPELLMQTIFYPYGLQLLESFQRQNQAKSENVFATRLPLYHVMNSIYKKYPRAVDRKGTRLILDVCDGNNMTDNEFIARFTMQDDKLVCNDGFIMKYFGKPCVVHKFHTKVPFSSIIEGVSYIVNPIEDAEGCVLVDVLKPFFYGVRFGIFETETAFLETYQNALNLDIYNPEDIIYSPIFLQDFKYGAFQKMSMSTFFLFEIFKLFVGCDFADIYTMGALDPIFITGVRKSESQANIQAILMPIDPTVKGGD
jgi:hypothetical protein